MASTVPVGHSGEAVVFCGIQGSGKTSFYLERFAATHVRISLDVLRTRHREAALLRACIRARQSFVVDNTNPTAAERRRYLEPARQAGFRLVGYFFDVPLGMAMARNRGRTDKAPIPVQGVIGTSKRLERPRRGEGFDELYRVTISPGQAFAVQAWAGPSASSGS